LAVIVLLRRKGGFAGALDARMALCLCTYMIFFSFAYLSLGAGTGALILFGSVQLTMFVFALRSGERFSLPSWCGFILAIGGLIYLVSPGITAPDLSGAVLMAVAGIAWGFYSLLGRGVADPLQATAKNFACCLPVVLVVSAIFWRHIGLSPDGIVLAVASGAIASGCGYVIWYAALPALSATHAATVQLSVPVIAAFGGILLLSEQVTLRLLLASAATLGGVAIVLLQRTARPSRSNAG
jgi:drug/metabolite transporter (DMT)-like permease